jgi:sporulation protein YqfC
MKRNIDNLKVNLSDALELPMDIALDIPKITIIGNVEINITNHRGIIEYNSNLIRINTKIGIIKLRGQDMVIRNILSEEITVSGTIESTEIIC